MFIERLGFKKSLLLNQFFLFMFSPFPQLSTHENSMGVQINNLRIPCTHNFLFCMILMRTDLKYNEVCNYLYHLDVHMSSERKAKGIYSFFLSYLQQNDNRIERPGLLKSKITDCCFVLTSILVKFFRPNYLQILQLLLLKLKKLVKLKG